MTDGVYEIGVTANADGVEAGVRQAKAALNGLGEAALREGERAGAGIAAMGEGGDQAASKVDRASRSIIASIQRATAVAEAGERNTSKYFEALANQRGVNTDVLRPYLSQLDEVIRQQNQAAAGLNGMNLSAGELKNALRSLPAQFTDIVTSLSSGQAPLTVFIQQGGQIKDQFGGAGAAVRAMGGYVAGLINPTNLLAAAAGALAVAYYQGSKESDALTNSILFTGNAAGTTTSQLNDMARAIAASTGATQGAGADALAQAVTSGKVAKENLQLVGEAAVRMQRATGQSVSDTVEEFSKLGKEPVKASQELNEKYGYLTASVYAQIKALEDQGKTLDAVNLAQQTYANAAINVSKQVEKNYGSLETVFYGLRDAGAAMWDAILGVGRDKSDIERIAELKQKLAPGRGIFAGLSTDEQQELKTLEARVAKTEQEAKAKADVNAQTKASIGLANETDKFLSKEEQKRREIVKVQQLYSEAVKGGTRSTAEIVAETNKLNTALAGIEDKYKERTRKTGKSQEQKDAEELAAILDRINGKFSGLDANYYDDLQKLWKAYGSGKLSLDEYRVAVERMTGEQKFAKDAARAQADAIKEFDKTLSDYISNHQKYLLDLDKEASKLEDQVLTYGLGKEALAQLTLARAQERLEMAKANGLRGNDLALLEQEVELRRRIASATSDLAEKDANKRAAERAGQEWQRVSDDIGRALTDSIFQGGKSGWDQLKKTVEATLIRATIQPVVTNTVGSVLQSAGFNVGGNLAGVGNLLSAGSSLAGIGNLSSFMGASGYLQFGSMASSFGTGLTAAAGGADLSAAVAAYEAAGMGATAGSLSAGASAAGALGSSAGAVGTAMSGLAAAAPYLAVGMLIAQQLGAFNGPTYHHGGAYMADTSGVSAKLTTQNYAGFDLGWGAYNSDRSASFDEAMKNMAYGIATQIAQSIKTFGGDSSGITVASRFASDNSDYSVGALRLTDKTGKVIFDLDKHYAAEAQKGMQEFTADATRALVGALKASNLDSEFASIFQNIDPLTSSLDSLNAALQQASAIQQTISSLQSAIDSAFLTPAEQLDKAFMKIGKSVPATASEYEKLIKAQDLNTSAGRDMAMSLMNVYQLWGQVKDAATAASEAALQAVDLLHGNLVSAVDDVAASISNMRTRVHDADAAMIGAQSAIADATASAGRKVSDAQAALITLLDQSATATRTFGASLTDYIAGISSSASGSMNVEARYRSLGAQLQSTSVLAQAGDQASRDKLTQVADAFLQASKARSTTSVDYARDEARVRVILQGVVDGLTAQVLSASGALVTKPISDVTDTQSSSQAQQIAAALGAMNVAQADYQKYLQLSALTGTEIKVSTDVVADEIAKLRAAYDSASVEQSSANTQLQVALKALEQFGLTEDIVKLLAAGLDGGPLSNFAAALGVSADSVRGLQAALGITDESLKQLAVGLNLTVSDAIYAQLGVSLGVPADLLSGLGSSLGVSPLTMQGFSTALGWDANKGAELSTAMGWDKSAATQLNTAIGFSDKAADLVSTVSAGVSATDSAVALTDALMDGVMTTNAADALTVAMQSGVGISKSAADWLAEFGGQAAALGKLSLVLGVSPEAQKAIDLFSSVTATSSSYGSMIDSAYQDAFGRQSDTAGRQFWMSQLYSGVITTDSFLAAFLSGAQGSDREKALAYGHKIGLPGFSVGTNFVIEDMPAIIHRGERIMPAADNAQLIELLSRSAGGNKDVTAALQELRSDIAEIRRSNENMSKIMTVVTRGGDSFLTKSVV